MQVPPSIPPGLIAITGDERTGKTSYLLRLCGKLPTRPNETAHPDARWLDLALPAQDDQTPEQVWSALKASSSGWDSALQHDLIDALKLLPHLGKPLFKLSTGSRRKVALVGLMSCGATVICLDQPYAALDMASIQVLRGFLLDMSDHTARTWVVADYEADQQLPWQRIISLDPSGSS